MKFATTKFITLMFSAISAASAAPVQFSAQGAGAADIFSTVNAFRSAVGTLNPNVAGSFGSGRREINWDGVPDSSAAPGNLPANFFNVNSPRGVVFSTPGTGFQVSANAGVAPVEFGTINPTYPGLFATFSPQRLFTSLGSNITDVNFFVPGSTSSASVSAFGAVFTDVDLANTTSLQFFDLSNQLLATTFFAPSAVGNETLSFLGVLFDAGERIGRVRITAGNAALGASVFDAGGTDLVVMDDFIYAEPIAASTVPEPATLLLVGPLLAALWMLRRRRLRFGQQERG